MFKMFYLLVFMYNMNFLFAVIKDDISIKSEADIQTNHLLDELFSYPIHSDSLQRRLVIKNWITQDNPSAETVNERFNFLITNWDSKYFRIFDTPKDATCNLNNSEQSIIIRLSSSKAGQISITFKKYGKIFHSRFATSGIHIIYDHKKFTMNDFLDKLLNKSKINEYKITD